MNAVFKVQMAKRAAIIYDLELYRPGGHANYTRENSDICYEVPVHPIHIDDLLSEEGVLPPKHKNRVGKVQKRMGFDGQSIPALSTMWWMRT